MSLALSTQTVHHRLRTKQLYIAAQASGSYTPGGDPLNLQAIVPSLGQADATIGYPGNIKDYSVVSAPPGFSASLVKGATLSTWGLQVFEAGAAAPGGTPLGLGTLSAAATQSTYTTAGLVTVLTATPPPLGAFVALSNGAGAAGQPFDGIIVQVAAVVAGVSYSFYFGQGVALDYTIATDTLKWQVVQAGAGNLLQAQALAAPITGILATAVLLTITQANSLSVGQFVYLSGTFKTASVYALGALVQVASATSTGWTAKWTGTIINQTSSEVATSSLLVTNGGAPVTTTGAFPITNSIAVASAASAAGLLTLTAANALVPGNIIVANGLATNTTINGSIAPVIATGLTNSSFEANAWATAASTHSEATGVASLLVTGTPSNVTGELPAGPYPAGALVAPFVIMVEGPKGQI